MHSSLLAQQECPYLASDQWHSVAGHGILFHCQYCLTLGCSIGLPLGRWWWACWRLGNIPCPCEHMLVFILFSTEESLVSSPLLLFCHSHNPRMSQLCHVLVPGVSLQLLVSLCSMCQRGCSFPQTLDGLNLVGNGRILWTCTGRNKMLLPSMSFPVLGEIAGVKRASLGGCLHNSRTRARWEEGFHNELNGYMFDLERDGLCQDVPSPWVTMTWQQTTRPCGIGRRMG